MWHSRSVGPILTLLGLGLVAVIPSSGIAASAHASRSPAPAVRAPVHAMLLSSEPVADSRLAASPSRLRLVFSEPIEGGLARITLVDTTGRPTILAARGDPRDVHAVIAPVDSLAPGGYRVNWRVVSADGHPVDGTYVFFVGDTALGPHPSGSTVPTAELAPDAGAFGPAVVGAPIVPSLLRGTALGTLMAVAGLLLFLCWDGSGEPSASNPRARRVITVLAVAAPVLLAAHLVAWLIHTSADYRLEQAWMASAMGAPVGQVELWRTGLALMTLWAWGLTRRPRLALAFAIASLIASGGVGHSAAIRPFVATPAKAIHLLAGAAWLGGLLWLTLGPDRNDSARFPAAARRVSSVALLAVIAVGASGIVQTLLFLPSLGDLVASAYGWIALAKLAGLLSLVGFGAYNRQRVMPRLSSDEQLTRAGGARVLRASVRREIVVMAVVIMLGGLLAYVPPPGEGAGHAMPTHQLSP